MPLDTSNRRLPPNIYLPKLHPCSRRSNRISDSHPVHSRCPPVHADEPASAGPLAFSPSSSLGDRVAIFASDVSVATCARSLRPLSRTRSVADRRGHFCLLRRDASPALVTRDAFRWSPFERLPPCGVSRIFRYGPSRISVVSKVTPSRSARRFLFAFAGSRSPCGALEVFPRG